jgi:hypothetical protein
MAGAVIVAVVGMWQRQFMLVLIAIFGFIACVQQRRMLRYMESAEPEFDPRFAAAYETQSGGRGAWFSGSRGGGGRGAGAGTATRRENRRAAKEAKRAEVQRQRAQAEEAEIDRILDKVRASGLQSLTRREQAALQRATDRQRGA